mgnify:CR=1 FL=1
MSRFLLDTHIALFGLAEPERIPARIRETLDEGTIYLSVISFWEVALKSMKKKLDVGDPRNWWAQALERYGATALPLRPEHISVLCSLEPVHQDPFDRALVAQAIGEDLTLVSFDAEIRKYASDCLRVLS